MKIYIYGAGSIGCYLGGRLVAAGSDMLLLSRVHVFMQSFPNGA